MPQPKPDTGLKCKLVIQQNMQILQYLSRKKRSCLVHNSSIWKKDEDGDNIIPHCIKCIIGKTYIFQVKVTISSLANKTLRQLESLKLKEMNNNRKQQKEGLRMEMKYPKKQSLLK